MNKKIIYLIILAIVVLALTSGTYYFGSKQGYNKGYSEGEKAGRAAAKVEAGQVVSNPMEKMPETNPFEEVVNPFGEGYKNPFE